MGRRAHQPDANSRRQVEAMAACGVPEADIGKVMGIDPKTLRKHYRHELDTGAIRASARIAQGLYQKAVGDGPQAVTASIFWLKTRAGWKDTTAHEISGRDGGPIAVEATSDRDLARSILFILAKAKYEQAGRLALPACLSGGDT